MICESIKSCYVLIVNTVNATKRLYCNIALLGKLIILKGRGKPHNLVISTWSKKKYARYIFSALPCASITYFYCLHHPELLKIASYCNDISTNCSSSPKFAFHCFVSKQLDICSLQHVAQLSNALLL